MKLLIATHNKEKLRRYEKLLSKFSDLEFFSLDDLDIREEAEESFENNIENAKHKAKFYGELSGMATIAIDEAVLTNFLPDNAQPGVYVRRFTKNKKELSDDEMVEVWKEIFAKYPQDDKKFIWDFAIAYYNPKSKFIDTINAEQISYVASKFSEKKSNGYPLSRVLSPESGGISYSDLIEEKKQYNDEIVFALFLKRMTEWIKL
jgi:inosine/xanthosine triphosphate pyrophosphatase family protein